VNDYCSLCAELVASASIPPVGGEVARYWRNSAPRKGAGLQRANSRPALQPAPDTCSAGPAIKYQLLTTVILLASFQGVHFLQCEVPSTRPSISCLPLWPDCFPFQP
jgi:hypothetical protein